MNDSYIILPFVYKSKEGVEKQLSLFIPKDMNYCKLSLENFFGINLLRYVEDRADEK